MDTTSLRIQIQSLTAQLDRLGQPPDSVPQFTLSANAVRQNEYLEQRNIVQSDLIRAYTLYIDLLKETTVDIVDVQHQLIDLIRIDLKRN